LVTGEMLGINIWKYWVERTVTGGMAVQTDLSQQFDRILDLIRTEQKLQQQDNDSVLPSLCLCLATFPEKVHTKWYEWMGQRPGLLVRMDGMVVMPSFKKQKKKIWA